MPANPFLEKLSIYKWKLPPDVLEAISTQFQVPGSNAHREKDRQDRQQLEKLVQASITGQRTKT